MRKSLSTRMEPAVSRRPTLYKSILPVSPLQPEAGTACAFTKFRVTQRARRFRFVNPEHFSTVLRRTQDRIGPVVLQRPANVTQYLHPPMRATLHSREPLSPAGFPAILWEQLTRLPT